MTLIKHLKFAEKSLTVSFLSRKNLAVSLLSRKMILSQKRVSTAA